MAFSNIAIAAAIWIGTSFGALASESISSGSGFVVDTLGNAITNAHVVKGCSKLQSQSLARNELSDFSRL